MSAIATAAAFSPAAAILKASIAVQQVRAAAESPALAGHAPRLPQTASVLQDRAPRHEAPCAAPADIVVQPSAASRVLAAQYDPRVQGATETVRGFDRIAMIEQGFAHLRNLFEIANAPRPEAAMDKRV